MAAPHQKNGPNTTNKLAEWLEDQLDRTNMTKSALAEQVGVNRGTVSRWMAPIDNKSVYRRPSTDNFIALGEIFGVDPVSLMSMTGLDVQDGMSSLKRDTISAVTMLPDHVLETLYPQIRALLELHQKERLPTKIEEQRKKKSGE